MRPTVLLFAATCCAGCLQAVDVVVLADGDRLTGTLQRLEKGKLVFQSRHSETPLQIDWKLVSGLTTEADVTLKRQDGTEETGRLLASNTGLALLAGGAVTAIQPAAVVALEPKAPEEDSPGWIRRALGNSSVSADFGQSYSGLAKYNQISSNSEVDYKGDRWDGSLITHYDYYGATESGLSTYQTYGRLLAERYIAGDHFFVFPYGFLGRQTASDGGKGQIRQYGGGVGWTFRRQQSGRVSLYAGAVRSIASGFTMASEQGRADARFDDALYVAAVSWSRTLKYKIATSVRLYYFKPMFEAGHHAMATDASAKIPLWGPAYFTVRAYDTPELRQSRLFSAKNLQLSSGIGIEF